MNRKQARSMMVPVLAYLAMIGGLIVSWEWSGSVWSRHPWIGLSEILVFTGFFVAVVRRRLAENVG